MWFDSTQSLWVGVNDAVQFSRMPLAFSASPPVSHFTRSSFQALHSPVSAAVTRRLPNRLGRGFACFDLFRELSRLGVRILSVREPWTDVDGPARELLAAVMAWVSGFERDRLIQRTVAGLERARREGKKLGRPRASPLKLAAAARLVADGASIRMAAKQGGVSFETLRRHLHAEASACA